MEATRVERVHWLFRPALCRRVPEPTFGGQCETRTLVTGATIQCLSHSANPAIEFGAAGWIPTSMDLLTRQVPLYVGHSSKPFGADTQPRTAFGRLPCACSSR